MMELFTEMKKQRVRCLISAKSFARFEGFTGGHCSAVLFRPKSRNGFGLEIPPKEKFYLSVHGVIKLIQKAFFTLRAGEKMTHLECGATQVWCEHRRSNSSLEGLR